MLHTNVILTLSQLGKKFNHDWLFDAMSAEFKTNDCLAITGHNGSGKSSLLKLLAGFQVPSKGEISLHVNQKLIQPENIYQYITYTAPYIDLIEEFTLIEMIEFYYGLKSLPTSLHQNDLPALFLLEQHTNKTISSFSSGMKQRLKLGLALYTNAPILMLDEPTSHLDEQGKAWFYEQLQVCKNNKLTIIASNDADDLKNCTQTLHIPHFAKHRN